MNVNMHKHMGGRRRKGAGRWDLSQGNMLNAILRALRRLPNALGDGRLVTQSLYEPSDTPNERGA